MSSSRRQPANSSKTSADPTPNWSWCIQHNRRLDEEPAISSQLAGNSPAGRERVWVVTVLMQEGLLYFACVASEKAFEAYEPVFTRMLDSVRFPAADRH